ncbi:Myc-type basic helix-loop-helix (bHLH) domain, partial [Trinorchestia longiramus]
MVSSIHVEPVSRSDQYKRVMKPLLERKRRARINRCLDELRDLLVSVLQAEGEAVTRLEKADILELTVRHVRRLSQRRRLALPTPGSKHQEDREDVAKFQQGFVAAAQQVQSFLMSTNSLEPSVSSRLLTHLTSCATSISPTPALAPSNPAPAPASTVNSQAPVQVAKQIVASRPPANSPMVANPVNATTVSPSNVLAPFLSTGSHSFQKSPPPPPVRIHQSATTKSLPTYQLNVKANSTQHQPLID